MKFKKQKVRYWFDTFKHLKSFDILPYQEVIDLYLHNHNLLNSSKEKLGGDNQRPLNSDKEHIDHKAFWLGHSPAYHNINPYKSETVTQAKADIISMDMIGLNKTWDHWIYLELPGELFKKYQTSVHSNPDITIFKDFLEELNKEEVTEERIKTLLNKYDEEYKEKYSFTDFFEQHNTLQWRGDLDEKQYFTLKKNGIIYPICFISTEEILGRGTHRAFLLSMSGSDVPVFLQYPKLKGQPLDDIWEVTLKNHFNNNYVDMKIDTANKKLSFFIDNKLIGTI